MYMRADTEKLLVVLNISHEKIYNFLKEINIFGKI